MKEIDYVCRKRQPDKILCMAYSKARILYPKFFYNNSLTYNTFIIIKMTCEIYCYYVKCKKVTLRSLGFREPRQMFPLICMYFEIDIIQPNTFNCFPIIGGLQSSGQY